MNDVTASQPGSSMRSPLLLLLALLLTARAQVEDLEQGRKAGSDAYLTKAFSPLKLLDLVDDMLGRTV